MPRPASDPVEYPRPGSLTLERAAKWYFDNVLRIPERLRDREPQERFVDGWEMKSRLRLAAATSLIEQDLAQHFLDRLPLRSIDDMLGPAPFGYVRPDTLRAAWQRLVSVTDEDLCAFPSTVGGAPMKYDRPTLAVEVEAPGIPAGFLVNTPQGLKAIHTIAAGDFVLAAPDEGAFAAVPKRVLSIVVHERRTLRQFNTFGEHDSGVHPMFAVSEDMRFWVEGRGWTRVDGFDRGDTLRTLDGPASPDHAHPVYRTDREGIGWVQNGSNYEESDGQLFDYANYERVEKAGEVWLSDEVYGSDERYLRVKVYNLVVEAFNNFFVAGHWVRGAVPTP